jgi:hypothetical protein
MVEKGEDVMDENIGHEWEDCQVTADRHKAEDGTELFVEFSFKKRVPDLLETWTPRDWILAAWSAISELYTVAEMSPPRLGAKVYDCCNRIQRVIPDLEGKEDS